MIESKILVGLSTKRIHTIEYWKLGESIEWICLPTMNYGMIHVTELNRELNRDRIHEGYETTQSRKELNKYLMTKELLK